MGGSKSTGRTLCYGRTFSVPLSKRKSPDDLVDFYKHTYAQCIARSENSSIMGSFEHLPPLITEDGGHGMLFCSGSDLILTFHSPNQTGLERPRFVKLKDCGDTLRLVP